MLNKFLTIIRSAVFYFLFALIIIFLGTPLVLLLVLTPKKYIQKNFLIYWLLAVIFRALIYATFLKFKVIYPQNKLPFPAVYVANHCSAADIVILGYLQGVKSHFWFYWDKFSHTPIFSILTTRLGLGIKQDDPRHDARTLIQGINLMKEQQCNAVIFPEGSRFNDGTVHQFLAGFVLLARKAQAPVIPVYIHNMGNAYPPHTILIYPFTVTVTVGEPLSIQPDESDTDFCNRVQSWFIERSLIKIT